MLQNRLRSIGKWTTVLGALKGYWIMGKSTALFTKEFSKIRRDLK